MAQRLDLVRRLERWTGSATQIVELTPAELDHAVRRGDELVRGLRRDGHVLVGPALRVLLAER